MNKATGAGEPANSTIEKNPLATLTLPRVARLSPAQIRGAACVWCSTELHGGDAVDLGQRYNTILGVPGRWFPRGCRPCTLKPVLGLVKSHPGYCEQCVDDDALCETRGALRGLALELRRGSVHAAPSSPRL